MLKLNAGQSILLIVCGLGIAQSIFFGFYLIALKEGGRTSNWLLAGLLVTLAIRLTKSFTYYFLELNDWFMNIGYAAHVAVFPLLFIYLVSFKKSQISTKNFTHLVPSLLILLLSFHLTDHFWISKGYSVILVYSICYLFLCWIYYFKDLKFQIRQEPIENRWILSLMIVLSVFGLSYFSNFILGITSYVTGPVLYSFMIYYLSYLAFRYYHQIFGLEIPIRKVSALSAEELEVYTLKLNTVLKTTKPYLDSTLTLPKLAAAVGIPSYRLSQIINSHFNKSFNDLINELRIIEAKSILIDQSKSMKIAAVAYECGFNTLSAFNSAFKKQTHLTPSGYRRQASVQTQLV